LAPASVVAPFDYTSMVWVFLLGYFFFNEISSMFVFIGAAIIAGAGLFVIWRERHRLAARTCGRGTADRLIIEFTVYNFENFGAILIIISGTDDIGQCGNKSRPVADAARHRSSYRPCVRCCLHSM
jgi:hypothetical protein